MGLGGGLQMDYRRPFNFFNPPTKKWLGSFEGTYETKQKHLQNDGVNQKSYLALYLNISSFGFKPCQEKKQENKNSTQCIFFYLHICVNGIVLV